jgi:hypothetical protein
MSDTNIRLTIRGGGWVLILLGIVLLAMLAWALAPAVLRMANAAPGDGTNIQTYAFDMSNLQLDEEDILAAMQHRNMSPVMHQPSSMSKEELVRKIEMDRDPFLVSSDLVVGVTLNGESRAYPMHMLDVHEIINDTLGGVPIVVSWHWPSGNATVYERTIQGAVLSFANSGLAGNGGLLMYGLQEEAGGEQLFSTLLGNTISGDSFSLQPVPHDVLSWKVWSALHKDTTSIMPVESFKKRYRKANPAAYFMVETIYFPASPMPEDSINPKAPIIAIPSADGYAIYNIAELDSLADENGEVKVLLNGSPITISVGNNPLWATAHDHSGNPLASQRALWFAWYANHPESVITNAEIK